MNRLLLLLTLLVSACGGTKTICATREAQAIEPRMNEIIALAVDYWADNGREEFVPTDGDNCDIPVRPVSVPGAYAEAELWHVVGHDDCYADAIQFDRYKWSTIREKGEQVRIMAHEVGHLFCLEHTADGVMSSKLGINDLDHYQLPPLPEPEATPEPEPTEPAVSESRERTICVTPAANEIDPTLSEQVRDALVYWQGQPGVELLTWTEPGECDVPVMFAELPEGRVARAEVDDCVPVAIEIQESTWPDVRDQAFVVVAHLVGHLLCVHHDAVGLMSENAVSGLD